MAELATIQKWLTSIIVRPGRLQEKINLADRHYQLDHTRIIAASESLTADEKIGIYARGYVLRLMECMEAEFPALQYLLGKELFSAFAGAYLSNLPPNSPDLYDLGRNFPAYLQASQPAFEVPEAEKLLYALPAELACLERAIAEVSRNPGLEGKRQQNRTDEFIPFFLFGHTGFQVSPCLKLLRQQFSLKRYLKAVQQQLEPQTPAPQETLLAVTRVNYAVTLAELETWQWHFLEALNSTRNYQAAVDRCAGESGISKDELLAGLLLWLPVAEESGLIFRP